MLKIDPKQRVGIEELINEPIIKAKINVDQEKKPVIIPLEANPKPYQEIKYESFFNDGIKGITISSANKKIDAKLDPPKQLDLS